MIDKSIYKKRLLTVLLGPHISEKSSISSEKFFTIIVKVSMTSNKCEIKHAIETLFKVVVSNINVLIVKGKNKRKKGRMTYRSNWKKAYVLLDKEQDLNLIKNLKN